MNQDWFWVVLICATPFVVFGALELATASRRKRAEARARRSKSRIGGK